MARPTFAVQYLVFCNSIEYVDPHRPYRDTILNGVDFVFGVPPATEFPFEPLEFWLFARFFSMSDQTGDTRPLSIVCCWLDSPTGADEIDVWERDVGSITFHQPREVLDRNWAFRNLDEEGAYLFPGPGRYVFKLGYRLNRWPQWREKAREYVSVEVLP